MHEPPSSSQRLDTYVTPLDWHPGASILRRSFWLLIGRPLVASWLPGTPWRKLLLRLFGARIGISGRIKPRLQVTFPWRLELGHHCWLGEAVWIDNLASVSFGDRVCVSQGAYLCTGNHDFRSTSFGLRVAPIKIESDAWIAARAVLAPGTFIGSGAVVALGAVVSGTVAAGAIMRGNPAVVVGWR